MNGHGGNIRKLAENAGVKEQDILDFSANINPIGPPPWLRSIISRNIENLINYPDPDCTELIDAISKSWKIDQKKFLLAMAKMN